MRTQASIDQHAILETAPAFKTLVRIFQEEGATTTNPKVYEKDHGLDPFLVTEALKARGLIADPIPENGDTDAELTLTARVSARKGRLSEMRSAGVLVETGKGPKRGSGGRSATYLYVEDPALWVSQPPDRPSAVFVETLEEALVDLVLAATRQDSEDAMLFLQGKCNSGCLESVVKCGCLERGWVCDKHFGDSKFPTNLCNPCRKLLLEDRSRAREEILAEPRRRAHAAAQADVEKKRQVTRDECKIGLSQS